MSDRPAAEPDRDDRDDRDGDAEPAVDGGTGPGVTPGDVETPGAATTANLPADGDAENEEPDDPG